MKFGLKTIIKKTNQVIESGIDPKRPHKKNALQGGLDSFFNGQFQGWMVKPGSKKPITFELLLDGQAVGNGVANVFRSDLKQAGYKDGCVGFELKTDFKLESKTYAVALKDCNSGELLELGPRRLHEQGMVDGIVGNVIHGWAINKIDPSVSVKMEVWVNNQKVRPICVSTHRPDISNMFRAEGHFGFSFSIDPARFDQPENLVQVRFAKSEDLLDNGSNTVTAKSVREFGKEKDFQAIELIRRSGLCSGTYYHQRYPDVDPASISAEEHYFYYGWKEGRDPSPRFSTEYYLETHQDVRSSKLNPLVHYILFGQFERRRKNAAEKHADEVCGRIYASGFFDAAHYFSQVAGQSLEAYDGDPVRHYYHEGWKKGYDPSQRFSTNYYLSKYADVQMSGMNPLEHWLSHGLNEHRHCNVRYVSSEQPQQQSPSLIFISHEASQTGAPAVLLTLMTWLKENTNLNFSVIVGVSGPWNDKFEALAPTFFFDRPHTGEDIKAFCGDHVQCIYTNTIAAAPYAKALEFLHAEYITHVHEMENVFKVFENEVGILKGICSRFIAVSQGSVDSVKSRFAEAELNFLKPFIGPYQQQELVKPSKKHIVFGCGAVELRKGFDIFCDVAQGVASKGIKSFEFQWIGTDQGKDLNAEEEISKRGLEGIVKFIGAKENPRDYFKHGALFLLPSREDPYPLVCMEAGEMELPVICFDETAGGMSTFVEKDAGAVVSYLDTADMVDVVAELLKDDVLRKKLGKKARQKVLDRHYVDVVAPKIFNLLPVANLVDRADSIDQYKQLIDRSKIVSFDIFDTLVTRRVADPNVAFDIAEMELTKDESGVLSLFEERMKTAGKTLRSHQGKVDDISIDEIYQNMALHKDGAVEKQVEIDLCIPHLVGMELYTYAKKQGKLIFITSDMYLDKATIEAILKNCGYDDWDEFFLSSDRGKKKDTGKLFALLKSRAAKLKVKPDQILHVGDNWIGDVKCPREAGLNAVRFTPLYESEGKLINLKPEARMALSQRGRIWESFATQATRIWADANPEVSNDFYTKLGFELTGPLAAMMAMHTKQLADRNGASKIVFMARDGRIIKKAFDRLYADQLKDGEYESLYLHLSRASVIPATMEKELTSNDLYFLIEGLHLGTKPIEYFLKRAKLDVQNRTVLKVVKKHFKDLQHVPKWEEMLEVTNMFNDLAGLIYKANEPYRKGLKSYLEHYGVLNKSKVIVVDVGWLLNIQSRLSRFLKTNKSATQVIGAYVGSREKVDKGIAHQSLLFDHGEPFEVSKFFEDNVTLFEVLFSSPEPSAKAIVADDDGFQLDLKSMGDKMDKECQVAQKLQMGAEEFFDSAAKAMQGGLPLQISKDYFCGLFKALVHTDVPMAHAELNNFEVMLGGNHDLVSYQSLVASDPFVEVKLETSNEYFKPQYFGDSDQPEVLIVTSAGLSNGSTRYRSIHLAESLAFNGKAAVVIHSLTAVAEADALIKQANTIVFQRCLEIQGNVKSFYQLARKYKKACWGEMDDLVFPKHIAHIGSVKGGEWDLKEAKFVAKGYEDFLKKLDGCIVSTDDLKTFIEKQYKMEARVVPNKISGASKLQTLNKSEEQLKLLYSSGTYSHKEDFKLIESSLYSYLVAHPDVQLSVLGAVQSSERLLALPNVSSYPLLPYEGMLKFISKHDVMIVPLEDDVFNNAKSNVKFIECASVGVPVIASSVKEYKKVIDPGNNGYLFSDQQAFDELLSTLDKDQLRQVGQKARAYVNEQLNTRTKATII